MDEATELEALWEFAHVLDILFRADRSQFLAVGAARPVLDRVLARLTDDDPRIPGVLGLPEVGRWMMEIDPEAAAGVFRRWYENALAAEDSGGMTEAAVALHRVDPAAAARALETAYQYVLRRVDCPAMGDFSRRAGAIAPDLIRQLAPRIPDRRERAEAIAMAAVGLYARDPRESLALIRAQERPVDRSSALLALVDSLLHTEDRPQPQPLLEELP
jgi:hypothetical protein